jgi:hypothetical protein
MSEDPGGQYCIAAVNEITITNIQTIVKVSVPQQYANHKNNPNHNLFSNIS